MLTHSLSKNTMDRWWWQVARIISLQKIYGMCGPEHHTVDFKWRCNPCGTENSTQTRANGLLEGWVSKKSKEIVRSAGLSRRIQSGVLSDSFEHHRALMTNLSDGLIGPALWSGIANLDFCNLGSSIHSFSSFHPFKGKSQDKDNSNHDLINFTLPAFSSGIASLNFTDLFLFPGDACRSIPVTRVSNGGRLYLIL